MVNAVSSNYAGAILSDTKYIASRKLSDGTCLQTNSQGMQTTGEAAQYDTLELSPEQSQVTLDVPNEITCEIPRAWTIMGETMQSFNDHLQWTLDEADSKNLSFGDRLTFLKEQGRNWVEDKRKNDPEMFAAWLKINRYSIEQGEADLVGLPSDFTMEEYYSYVKEPFSALA